MSPPKKPPIPHGPPSLLGGVGGMWIEIGNIGIKYKFTENCKLTEYNKDSKIWIMGHPHKAACTQSSVGKELSILHWKKKKSKWYTNIIQPSTTIITTITNI